MTRIEWGLLIWCPLFGGVFLTLELPAKLWSGCPWPTLSEFVWLAIRWWHPVATVVTVILIVLLGHFDEHWRVRYLIAATALGAAAVCAHLLLRY